MSPVLAGPRGVREKCRWGVNATVTEVHTGHGRCYDVRHEDGSRASYDHEELGAGHLSPQTQVFVQKVMNVPMYDEAPLAVGDRVVTSAPISTHLEGSLHGWPDFLVGNRRWNEEGVVVAQFKNKGATIGLGYLVEHADTSLAFYYRVELVPAIEYGLLAATLFD